MISTVNTSIIASLLSLTSAGPSPRAVPGQDCWYSNYYCSNTDGAESVLVEGATYDDKIRACYDECNAATSCNDFTLVSSRGGQQARCYFLTELCEKNSADSCITSDVKTCTSGPSDCGPYEEAKATCDPLEALGPDFPIWNCMLGEQKLNPYNEVLPVDTICTQTCPAWKTTGTDPPRQAQLESRCEDNGVEAQWSETVTTDGKDIDLLPTYPKPDEGALKCSCLPLELKLKWPYDATGESGEFYNPNAEEAAEFICKKDLESAADAKDWTIKDDNSCTLYCDNHYVATVECVAGEWTGNPEWGFWCYDAPATSAP